ncbi:MAG: DUF1194 domain-containing protein [Pseudomonadota bacterium]
MRLLLSLLSLLPLPAVACDLALLFAVDVSGSVDPSEYRIQMEGLAEALRDDQIAEALVAGKTAMAVVQWTGSSRQRLTVPWTQVTSHGELDAFAVEVAGDRRVWRNFSTAIGEAIIISVGAFADAPQCGRRVIDVSSDGVSNEGTEPRSTRPLVDQMKVTVNALVIEDATAGDLTGYFYENVISGPGAFVVTADGYADYPDRMRQKLLREVIEVVSLR